MPSSSSLITGISPNGVTTRSVETSSRSARPFKSLPASKASSGTQVGEPAAVTMVTMPPRTCWVRVTVTGTPTASPRWAATSGARCSAKIPRPSNVPRYNFSDSLSMQCALGTYSMSIV